MKFIEVAKKEYVIGLWWQLRPGGPANKKIIINLARERASELSSENFNSVVIRANQYGLGNCERLLSRRKKIYSLAAALRPVSTQETFIGTFKIEDGLWWIYVSSKGVIAANGDQYFNSREDAEKAVDDLKQLFAKVTEQVCLTPEETFSFFETHAVPECELVELFESKERKRGKYFKLGLAFLILVTFLTGIKIKEKLEEDSLYQARIQAREHAKKSIEMLKKHPENFFDMKWLEAFESKETINQCYSAIMKQPIISLGWALSISECYPSSRVVTLRTHNVGSQFINLPIDTELLDSNTTKTTLHLQKISKKKEKTHTSLLTHQNILSFFYDTTQKYNLNLIRLSFIQPERIKKRNVDLICPWLKGEFELSAIPSSVLSDPNFIKSFDIPGLVIKKVVFRDEKWTVEGEIYIKSHDE